MERLCDLALCKCPSCYSKKVPRRLLITKPEMNAWYTGKGKVLWLSAYLIDGELASNYVRLPPTCPREVETKDARSASPRALVPLNYKKTRVFLRDILPEASN